MSLYNIGCIYPSRGLLYMETFKEVLRELKALGAPYTIYWSHGNSLPSCFNKPLTKALKGSHTHIWFIEDDMVFPEGILKDLLAADEDIISCDYPIAKYPSGTILYDCEDQAIFTGTGCMLAKPKVFANMPRPIFRADIEWVFKQIGNRVKFTAKNADPNKVYGHHDISFGIWQYMNNKPIAVSKHILAQRKLVKKGDNSTNNGADVIELFDQYRKINFNNIAVESFEESKDKLLELVIIDGKRTYMLKSKAQELLAKGLAKVPTIESRNIMIDISECDRAIKYLKEKI